MKQCRIVQSHGNNVPCGPPGEKTYHKVANRNTCYYLENQVFGGATNQDMSLNETCLYS